MAFLGTLAGALAPAVSSETSVGALRSAGSGLLSALGAYSQEQSSRSWQEQQAQAQRNWASLEADKNRQFNREEAQKEREWNSIVNRVKRAGEAGLNPLSAVEQSGAMDSAVASNSSVPAGASSLEAGAPNGVVNLQSLAQVLHLKAQAAKIERETGRYDEQVDAQIKSLASQAALNNAQEQFTNMQNMLNRLYGKHERVVGILKAYNEAMAASAAGDKDKAQAKLAEAQKKLTETEDETKNMQLPLIKQRMEEDIKLVQKQQETEEAKQEELGASAQEHRAGAALKLEQKESQMYETSIKKIESEKNEATKAQQIDSLLAQLSKETAVAQNEQLRSDIQAFRDSLNDPRKKDKVRQHVDAALDWLRQKFGLGVSTSISIK